MQHHVTVATSAGSLNTYLSQAARQLEQNFELAGHRRTEAELFDYVAAELDEFEAARAENAPPAEQKKELGDVFITLASLANTTGLNAEESIELSRQKIARRLEWIQKEHVNWWQPLWEKAKAAVG